MSLLKIYSLIVLFIYFAVLLVAVAKEKKNRTILDYFFRRQNASILGFIRYIYCFLVGCRFCYFYGRFSIQ